MRARRLAAVLLPLLAALAAAQHGAGAELSRPQESFARRDRPPAIDPYTRAEAQAMRKAGYVSFGPFAWTDNHTTADIQQQLGNPPLLWVETEHFKIGSSLSALAVNDAEDPKLRGKLRKELEVLGKRLPRITATAGELDAWLRLHLAAQRCELVYADLQRRLGAKDEDFPASASAAFEHEPFMGTGPYLGMPMKYTVLLFEEESSFARYFERWIGAPPRYAQRHHFRPAGSLLFVAAAEHDQGNLRDDTRLHCMLVFNVVHNLIDGYRGYYHELPAWLTCGLAQWYARRIDARHCAFNQMHEGEADVRRAWQWRPLVRALVQAKSITPGEDLMARADWSGWKFEDHVQSWSRVDWLMSLGDERFATFLNVLKDPFDRYLRTPSRLAALARQDEALAAAYGIESPAAFDARWTDWVRANYER